MKENNPHLTFLIVQEYTRQLYWQLCMGLITAEKMTKEVGAYMYKLGMLPREVVVLAVCAYITLL